MEQHRIGPHDLKNEMCRWKSDEIENTLYAWVLIQLKELPK